MKDIILQGNCLETLKNIPDESVDCCITSPPYYGLRDYGTGKWIGGDPTCPHRRTSKFSERTITGHAPEELRGNVGDAIYKTVCPLCGAIREDKQIGLEESPEEYIERLVSVFREVKRVLKPEGTLWVNIGDSYAAQRGGTHQPAETLAGGIHGVTASGDTVNRGREKGYNPTRNAKAIGLKHKDLIGIPWLLAFALRNDGWYLRQDIIWHKPNPMPESVKDRCTKSHEYIFLLSKRPKYYFDYESIREKGVMTKGDSAGSAQRDTRKTHGKGGGNSGINKAKERLAQEIEELGYSMRNKRDVWTVTPAHYKEAHFATFPEELVKPMLLAGCPKDGIVLDPFMGSGTTGAVAILNGRHYIGCELNEKYIEMANKRISDAVIIANQVTFNDLIDKQMTFDNLLKIGEQT